MDSVYLIASAAFGVGVFSGYLLRKNWFLLRTLSKKQPKALNDKNANKKKNEIGEKNQEFKSQIEETNQSVKY